MWLPSMALSAALLLAPVDPSFAPARPSAPASTWFVRADALPGGTGGRSDPFDTIQEGIEAARPGDRVDVGPGTYRGELHTVRSGEPRARIVLVERDAQILGDGDDRLVEIEHDFVTVRGFEIADADVLMRIEGRLTRSSDVEPPARGRERVRADRVSVLG